MAGFRNVAVHQYEELDLEVLRQALGAAPIIPLLQL